MTRVEVRQEIRVIPDLSAVRGVLGSVRESLILDGTRIYRKQTAGSEFHYIREYSPDDDPRMINWTATARQQRLMTNVRQPEKGKIVMLLLDCGRIMGTLLDGRTKLDRTLEAALTLAAVALGQGDQVGALAFAGEVRTYVPPGKGLPHLQKILDAVYDLQSFAGEAGYERALLHLMHVQKKRSLAVLFTDMDHHLLEERLLPYLVRLRRMHVPLVMSLQNPVMRAWSRAEGKDTHTAFIRSTAQKWELDRRGYTKKLAGMGIHVLDVPADRLALAAVNTYLEIKSREAF
nr:DUF58 domain-containing protein [Paenibacillus hamazuiensis]